MSASRRNVTSEELKNEVLAKIKEYADGDFPEAIKIHERIMHANPSLCPRLWYGMPGYAKTKDSAVLCFFRKDTLISFGLTEAANLDNSRPIQPSAWYIAELTGEVEDEIVRVVEQATL